MTTPPGPAIVTDSNSQLPQTLRERFDIEVVPITVVVDGREYREGIDLDADAFYDFFADGHTPEITTSQPSPGEFVEAYRRCRDRDHDEIVSIHVMQGLSGTVNSARLAAEMVDLAVHVVDSGTASFGIACCVWEAALARAAGAGADRVASVAQATASTLHSITAVGAADLLRSGGRVAGVASHLGDDAGIDLIATGPGGAIDVLGKAHSETEVCDRLAAAMSLDGQPIRVALGIADASAAPYYEGLERRLRSRGDVTDIVRYRIGPSVGAFTGPGTAGGFWWPALPPVTPSR